MYLTWYFRYIMFNHKSIVAIIFGDYNLPAHFVDFILFLWILASLFKH